MVFYHGTTEENWQRIQEEGILYGRRFFTDGETVREVSRCTYLAVDVEEANEYGNVILQVEYNPFKHKKMNNYIEGCWQVRVYEPIPLSNVRRIEA